MQYIMAGKHNSLPLFHVGRNGFKLFLKGFNRIRWPTIRNVQSANVSLFSYHHYMKTMKWYKSRPPPSVTGVCA